MGVILFKSLKFNLYRDFADFFCFPIHNEFLYWIFMNVFTIWSDIFLLPSFCIQHPHRNFFSLSARADMICPFWGHLILSSCFVCIPTSYSIFCFEKKITSKENNHYHSQVAKWINMGSFFFCSDSAIYLTDYYPICS